MPQIDTGQQQIFYRSQGVKDAVSGRPPLLLVHGAGGTLMNWPSELRRLPGTPVYALDLPGHGNSSGLGLASIGDYSDAVLAFADALDLPRFVIVGHSMGSAIAIEVALRRPDRLAGLVLVGANARLAVAPALLTGLGDQYDETAARLVKLLFGPETNPLLSAGYLHYLSTLDRDVVRSDFAVCDSFDRSEQVRSIHTPTLIVCGADDRMTPPAASDYLHREIADSRLVLVENAGHMVMLEKPEAVATEVAGFLSSLLQ